MIGAEPISSISTPNRTQCHRECLLAIDKCKSINVAEKPKGFECETMPVDIYTGGVLVEDADSTHYIIAVSILYYFFERGVCLSFLFYRKIT